MGYSSRIIATTGFQNRTYIDKKELFCVLEGVIKSEEKVIEYTMSSLRSASEIYKKGGHVTMKHRDQLFRLHYDNRRVLDVVTSIPPNVEKLVDSQPLQSIKHGRGLRFICALRKKSTYSKFTASKENTVYKNDGEIAIRKFLKSALSVPPLFNIPSSSFESNRDLLAFVKAYNTEIKISVEVLSRYKRRGVKIGKIKRTKDAMKFTSYVKTRFPSFDEDQFYLTD